MRLIELTEGITINDQTVAEIWCINQTKDFGGFVSYGIKSKPEQTTICIFKLKQIKENDKGNNSVKHTVSHTRIG